MSQESPRIAELRRRVQADPASIAFGQLAEEYRRAGHYKEAVQYCRTGLARHPGYLSARVTLGRALMDLSKLDEAAREFDLVLRSAPDNLAAIRGMAEIQQRRGAMEQALDYYKRALELARFDPDLEETVQRIRRELGDVAGSPSSGMSFEEAHSELLSAASRVPMAPTADGAEPLIDFDALLATLGVPDAAPPPATEMLLSEPPSAAVRPEPALPDLPAEPPAHDPFEALELALRAFDPGRAALPPNPPAAPPIPEAPIASIQTSDPRPQPSVQSTHTPAATTPPATAPEGLDEVLTELESWLQALAVDQDSPPAA